VVTDYFTLKASPSCSWELHQFSIWASSISGWNIC